MLNNITYFIDLQLFVPIHIFNKNKEYDNILINK
jgi:hypothetical protein